MLSMENPLAETMHLSAKGIENAFNPGYAVRMARRPSNPAGRRVAICVDKSRSYGRGVLRGIAEYVETHGRWSLHLDPRASGAYGADWLCGWDGDGVLAFIEDPALADSLRRAGIPAVELFGHRFDLGLAHVGNDEEAFGRLAAEHLLERHFRHFAFTGIQGALWSERRRDGFVEALRKGNLAVRKMVMIADDRAGLADWEANQLRLRAWLRDLPKPCGLMACSDRHALRVLDACRTEGIAVPQEIAVVGVDNDEETCRLAHPPLTSVMDNARQVGWCAAALLDELMARGQVASNQRILVPPLGVATRRSTEVTAVDDPLVARACDLIRERACEGLGVPELLATLRISKTSFYARFKKCLGRLPHEEILRTRLGRAQCLLRETGLSTAEIAGRCGFTHPEYLNVAFKRELRQTPGAFRRQARADKEIQAKG
jgi:LacI family transcriptional regulator